MFETLDNVAIDLSDADTLRVALRLAQTQYRTRLLTTRDLREAAAEAEDSLNGLGLTLAERVGTCIEVSASEMDPSHRGGATATFAELERTRTGWQMTAIARRENRRTRTSWLATKFPSEVVLGRAAARVLRRGTDGTSRLRRS